MNFGMQIADCGAKNKEIGFFFLVINSEIRIPKSEIKVLFIPQRLNGVEQ
jgi:hypothetical protein